MDLTGLTKLCVCVMVLIATVILGCVRVIDGQAVVAVISGVLGYVYGNSHGIISAKNSVSNNDLISSNDRAIASNNAIITNNNKT